MARAAWWRRSVAALLLSSVATLAPAAHNFQISAGPASQGITRFAQQAGVPVLFPYALVEGRRTQALQGRHELDAGLQLLLEGSGLVAFTNARGQLTIRPAAAAPERTQATAQREADVVERPFGLGDVLPELAITGTRIERDGMTTPTPVAAITSIELSSMGAATLVDALVQLPHFLNNDTPQTQSFGTSGAAGASYLNLRGIGSIRTLTLLDGRRVAPSTRFGTVDIALFPRNLIQRVEVVTGGASAAYGSDAMSGVVNMLLETDFRGVRAHAQTGVSEYGDFDNREFGFAWGTRIGEQSSLLLSAEAFQAEGIRGYSSRDWFRSRAAITDPGAPAGGPREVFADNVRASGYTYGGLITSGPLAGTQFLEGGETAPFVRGDLATNLTHAGGSGVDPAGDMVWLLPDQRRLSAFARFTTHPSASISAFAQLLAGRSDNYFEKDPPSLWGSWEATIQADNAFLPQAIRDRMTSEGIGSFRMGRMAADGELGRGEITFNSDLLSVTTGLEAHLDRWTLQGYYQTGRNLTTMRFDDVLRVDRIYRAIDSVVDPSTGSIVCRSTLTFPDDGCVPANIFGRGSVTDAARDYVTEGSSNQIQDVREQVAETSALGELPWLGDGQLSVAAGASWRQESVDVRAHRFPVMLEGLRVEPAATQGYLGLPGAYSNHANIFERTSAINVRGRYSVWELFGEAVAPLVRDRPGARRVDLNLALRGARYSGSGGIPAWKVGLDWQIGDALRLRATRSRDVRAGSLSERYDVASSGVTIQDTVQADVPVYAVVGDRVGNPAIEPEKGDTTTVGFVLTPVWAAGLSLSADYYDIRIRDAIALYGVQNIIDSCAAGAGDMCDLITRDTESGHITRVANLVLNVAEARSRGMDMELAWRRPLTLLGGGESVALRAFANYTFESSTRGGNGEFIDRAGQTGLFGGAPRWQANVSLAYERGPLQLMLQQRLISSGTYNATYTDADLADRHVRGMGYTNLRAAWHARSLAGTSVYLSVENLLDNDPPLSSDWGFIGSMPTNEGLFDVLGRRYSLGVRFEL